MPIGLSDRLFFFLSEAERRFVPETYETCIERLIIIGTVVSYLDFLDYLCGINLTNCLYEVIEISPLPDGNYRYGLYTVVYYFRRKRNHVKVYRDQRCSRVLFPLRFYRQKTPRRQSGAGKFVCKRTARGVWRQRGVA